MSNDYTPDWANIRVTQSSYDNVNNVRFWTSKFKATQYGHEASLDVSKRRRKGDEVTYTFQMESGCSTMIIELTPDQMQSVLGMCHRVVYGSFAEEAAND
jgi:hypothetical protein